MLYNILLRQDAILHAVAAKTQGATVSELSAQLTVPRSSLYRLLTVLTKLGHLSIDKDGRYRIGSRIAELSSGISLSPQTEFLDALIRSAAEIIQRAIFHAYFRNPSVELLNAALPVTHTQPYVLPRLGERPLTRCSSSLAILAYQEPKSVDKLIETLDVDCTPTQLSIYHKRLAKVREVGYAISDGDDIPGVMSIAFPVRTPEGIFRSIGLVGFRNQIYALDVSSIRRTITELLKSRPTLGLNLVESVSSNMS